MEPNLVGSLVEDGKYSNETFLIQKLTNRINFIFHLHRTNIKPVPATSPDLQSLSIAESKIEEEDVNKVHVGELKKLEDDETRKDSSTMDSIFYRDAVKILTDKTFNKTVNESPLLAVLFFVNFDSVSILLKPIFSNVNQALSKAYFLS